MSKRNLFLGTAAGKVGDVVVYRAGGTQRARVRVVPKDPKTSSQMVQRSRIGGVVATYRAAKGLLQDTFESKPSKQSAYNAFAQEALPTAPVMLKKLVDAGCAFPMPMTISRGSLPNPFSSIDASSNELDALVQGANAGENPTVKAISEALIAARPCCFKNGTEVIGIAIEYIKDESMGNDYYKPHLVVEKFKLDTSDTTAYSGSEFFEIEQTADGISFNVIPNTTIPVVMGIVIANTDSDGIHVTSAQGYMNTAAQTLYTQWTTATREQEVAESYGASGGSCVL